jgi:hypothetical protein
MKKQIKRIPAIVALSLAVTLCVPNVLPVYQNVQTADAAYKNIFISSTKMSVVMGDTRYLRLTGAISKKDKAKLTWQSSDTSIVSVDKNGQVKAVGYGTATVTTKYQNKSYSCDFTVHHADVITSDLCIHGETLSYYNGNDESYTIPDYITKIDETAFLNRKNLKSITIPNGVTIIENNAFQWCSSLESITIPDSVTSIGKEAFLDCGSLTTVILSKSMTKIETNTFCGCYGLKNITIPSSITKIDDNEFRHATNLTITGQAGSYAETYAKAHNYTFVAQ